MDRAREIESIMGERTKRIRASVGARSNWRLGLLHHLEGVRLITESEPTVALEKLQSADDNLQYWGQGQGLLKLFNRLHIAVVLGELGQANEAQNILEEIAKVNPRITEFYTAIRDSLTTLTD